MPLDENLVTLLRTANIVSDGALETLREQSHGDQAQFERLLVEEGHVTSAQLGMAIAQEHGWRAVDLAKEVIPDNASSLLPEPFALHHTVVVFRVADGQVDVATIHPDDAPLLRALRKKFGRDVRTSYATSSVITDAIRRMYDRTTNDRIRNAIAPDLLKDENSAVELFDALLLHAARQHASDIHIEPNAENVLVRERVDGMLHTVTTFSRAVHERMAQRIKVLANLASDEHAVCQDGKFTVQNLDGKRADVRVSIVPTTHGEDFVLRLLISERQAMPLDSLGFDAEQRAVVEEEIQKSWGMILVTGPTGSGKTTSLYATVLKIQREEISIASIEDPVEYDLPGTNQIQVHEKIGVTFATGLRSLVRHDPNIILVGEIRDPDTAGIAVNAALTGHLVLSTLHTNDAAGAIPRLCDMGIEPFLLSSTVNIVIAQRLVRTICARCKESYEVRVADLPKVLTPAAVSALVGKGDSVRLFRGKGCPLCNHTGFRGRTGIFELLRVTNPIRALVMKRADADTIRTQAIDDGMETMIEDGLQKAKEGVTTIEEVLRVIRQ